MNYLEGLEWVYKYYTKDCPDMEWKYKYNYAPLMKDLIKYIPNERYEFIKNGSCKSLKREEQLMYVLPYENLYLLGEKGEELKEKYEYLYPKHYEFTWGYCRYFWEAHPKIPEITMEMLKKM
jgi:5'-3' exonuclease